MDKKNNSNNIPDFSKVFNIDSSTLPKELIEKDPDASTKNLGFLSGNEEETLTQKEKKARAAEEKAEKKKKKINRLKNRLLIILLVIVFVFTAGGIISAVINENKKPVVTIEKPVIQTLSRYTQGNGVCINTGGVPCIVFIDNDYDVHYIEKGQTAEITDENGTVHKGKITDIKEAAPDTDYIKNYYSVLTGDAPSTSVYAVFVTPDDNTVFTKEGSPVKVKVLTKTSEDALTVSSSAVQIDGNQPYVWVYSSVKKTLTRQDVKVGITVDGITEITGGLKKTHRVISSFSCPENQLYDGIKVKTDG